MTQKFYVHPPWSERSERGALMEGVAWAVTCVAIRLLREATNGQTLDPATEAFYAERCKNMALDLVAALYKDRVTISILDRWSLLDMIPEVARKVQKLVGTTCPLKRGGVCTHCTKATGCVRRPGDDHNS